MNDTTIPISNRNTLFFNDLNQLQTVMPSFTQVTLMTPRLKLRWLEAGDAAALFDLFSHATVMRYWSTPPWTDMAQAHASIQAVQQGYQTGSSLRFGIELIDTGACVGTATLFNFDWSNRRAELGYALANPHWGRGLMQEALEATLTYAFDALKLHRIEADIDPRNVSSGKVLKRLGFHKEGYLRERWFVGGEISDSALYGLLAADWQQRSIGPTAADFSEQRR